MAWWQWERHLWKLGLIADLRGRLELPISDLGTLAAEAPAAWDDKIFRRVKVSGTYDFSHEMLLRNRKLGKSMGFHVITPLRIDGGSNYILVDRGYIPQTKAGTSDREAFQNPEHVQFTGLIKESSSRKFLAPADPESGSGHPWVERWLRVDIPAIQRQLPYQVLPVFLEIVETNDTKAVEQSIVDEKNSGRDEMFLLGADTTLGSLESEDVAQGKYPVPVFDTVLPPGRHLGYVFEWSFMALMTMLVGLILQLRRPRAVATA